MINFDIEKTVQYWREGSEYDMGVAEALLEKGKCPYTLFMGHLALEKLLKALVVKATLEHAPFTHSLTLLVKMANIEVPQEISDKLARFMEFHFEARYPEEQNKFYQKCTEEFGRENLQGIKEVLTWLKERY